jgi:hypothetical protein
MVRDAAWQGMLPYSQWSSHSQTKSLVLVAVAVAVVVMVATS